LVNSFDCRVLHTMVYCLAVQSAILATAWILVLHRFKLTVFSLPHFQTFVLEVNCNVSTGTLSLAQHTTQLSDKVQEMTE